MLDSRCWNWLFDVGFLVWGFGFEFRKFDFRVWVFDCCPPPPVFPPPPAFGPRGGGGPWLLDFGIWDLWFGIVEFRRLGSLILVG